MTANHVQDGLDFLFLPYNFSHNLFTIEYDRKGMLELCGAGKNGDVICLTQVMHSAETNTQEGFAQNQVQSLFMLSLPWVLDEMQIPGTDSQTY